MIFIFSNYNFVMFNRWCYCVVLRGTKIISFVASSWDIRFWTSAVNGGHLRFLTLLDHLVPGSRKPESRRWSFVTKMYTNSDIRIWISTSSYLENTGLHRNFAANWYQGCRVGFLNSSFVGLCSHQHYCIPWLREYTGSHWNFSANCSTTRDTGDVGADPMAQLVATKSLGLTRVNICISNHY